MGRQQRCKEAFGREGITRYRVGWGEVDGGILGYSGESRWKHTYMLFETFI